MLGEQQRQGGCWGAHTLGKKMFQRYHTTWGSLICRSKRAELVSLCQNFTWPWKWFLFLSLSRLLMSSIVTGQGEQREMKPLFKGIAAVTV